MSQVIEIKNLSRQYGKLSVLNGLSASVGKGDVVALLGKNGSGKTTLLETCLGFGFPAAGEAKLWGEPAVELSSHNKQRIGFVPQQDQLLSNITGKEHLRLFKDFRTHWNTPLIERLVAEWEIPLDRALGSLSTGQRQKMSILLALAHDPELLVLDEPVASLDPLARRQFLQQLVDLVISQERTIIFSTHIISDIERIASRVWMLGDGKFIYQGELDALKEQVARIRVKSDAQRLALFSHPQLVNKQLLGGIATLTFIHWDASMRTQLIAELGDVLDHEYLSLEDIFLELNRHD